MNCILNVCQSYEMFFSLFLTVKLLYVPFSKSNRDTPSMDRLNQSHNRLLRAVESFAFERMRNSFLCLVVASKLPSCFSESDKIIDGLGSLVAPSDARLKAAGDKGLSRLLMRVKNTEINRLRNDVVHKMGHRPRSTGTPAWPPWTPTETGPPTARSLGTLTATVSRSTARSSPIQQTRPALHPRRE